MTPVADSPNHHFRFSRPLDIYLDSANELRQLAEAIEHGALRSESIEERFEREAARLFPERPKQFHAPAAKLVHSRIHERMDGMSQIEAEDSQAREALTEAWEATLKEDVTALTGNQVDFWIYSEVWGRVASSRWGSDVLLASLLTTAIADFEVLVSRLIEAIIVVRPEILGEADRTYTLKELRAFDDLGAVESAAIDERVASVMGGGYESWAAWLVKRGVDVAGVTTDIDPELLEVFQRRHVLVHNGGMVDSNYLAKVPGSSAVIGDRLRVASPYLDGAIDRLMTTALKMGFGSLHQFLGKRDSSARLKADHEMDHHTFSLLFNGRDRVVLNFESWATPLREGATSRLVGQVNRWLAEKRLGSVADIQSEVEGWDTSPLGGPYKLAKLALLERVDDAHGLARILVDSGELTRADFGTWPLLESVRIHDAALADPSMRIATEAFGGDH